MYGNRAVERGEKFLERSRTRAEEADVLGTTVLGTTVETGPPARTIVRYVTENHIDHVVMGSHGRSGVVRVLIGSVAEFVTRQASVPVTTVP